MIKNFVTNCTGIIQHFIQIFVLTVVYSGFSLEFTFFDLDDLIESFSLLKLLFFQNIKRYRMFDDCLIYGYVSMNAKHCVEYSAII